MNCVCIHRTGQRSSPISNAYFHITRGHRMKETFKLTRIYLQKIKSVVISNRNRIYWYNPFPLPSIFSCNALTHHAREENKGLGNRVLNNKTSSPKGNDRSPESHQVKSLKYFELFSSKRAIVFSGPINSTMSAVWMCQKSNRENVETSIFRCSRAVNSIVSGPIWPKFELMQDIMHVYVTSNFKKDWINTNREKVETLMF